MAKSAARLIALAAPVLLVGCDRSVTDTEVPFGPLQMAVVSGDAQAGPAGVELPDPLVVTVHDERGRIVRGQLVAFRVVSGGGSMYAGVAMTDGKGVAQDYWTLGAEGPQVVEARAVDPTTGEKLSFATFTATIETPELPPEIALAPTAITFTTMVDAATAIPSQTVEVTNSGAGSLTDLELSTVYGSEASGWLTATLDGTTAPATITLAADHSGLAVGEYSAELLVSSPVATNDPQTVTIALHVSPQVAVGSVVLNEVDYDQPSTDTEEFIEIFNSTASAVDLTGLAVVLVNGADSQEYDRVTLQGTLAPGEFAVICTPALAATLLAGTTVFLLDEGSIIQNGPDGIALFNTTTNELVDALSYEGPITEATIVGAPGTYSVVEGSLATASDPGSGTESLIRYPDGADTDDAASDWSVSTLPTPGVANAPPVG